MKTLQNPNNRGNSLPHSVESNLPHLVENNHLHSVINKLPVSGISQFSNNSNNQFNNNNNLLKLISKQIYQAPTRILCHKPNNKIIQIYLTILVIYLLINLNNPNNLIKINQRLKLLLNNLIFRKSKIINNHNISHYKLTLKNMKNIGDH